MAGFTEQVVKHVADMLELSIVRTYDWWDLLVWLLLGPFAGGACISLSLEEVDILIVMCRNTAQDRCPGGC